MLDVPPGVARPVAQAVKFHQDRGGEFRYGLALVFLALALASVRLGVRGVGKFVAAIDLRKDAAYGLLSGIDTTNPGSAVTLRLNSTAGYAAAQTMNVFVMYDAQFAVFADGSVRVIE